MPPDSLTNFEIEKYHQNEPKLIQEPKFIQDIIYLK